jgi:hypothetical protein
MGINALRASEAFASSVFIRVKPSAIECGFDSARRSTV